MAQDPGRTAKAYDAIAEQYAEHFRGEHEKKPLDREVLARFAREAAGKGPVWDLGCGPGHTAGYLKSLGAQVCGLDLSEKMLERARRTHPDIVFKRGDLLDLPFADESLSAVIAFYAIVHFSRGQVRKAFRETWRVLAPGGLFLCSHHVGDEIMHLSEFLGRTMDIDFMFFPTDFILRALQEAGFKRLEAIEREPYPEVEYPSRRAYVFARKRGGDRG